MTLYEYFFILQKQVNFDLYTSTSTKVLDDIPENEKVNFFCQA